MRGASADVATLALSLVQWLASPHPAGSQDAGAAQSFKGVIAPARSYEIAPAFDGQITKIAFVAGQYVPKGALLFTLDTTQEELELERDRARLLRAQAQLRVAELALRWSCGKRTSYPSGNLPSRKHRETSQ